MTFLRDLSTLTGRLMLRNFRMPAYLIISIVQPIIWLLLFGQLFAGVTKLAGFGTDNYMEFLAPGLAIMSALFGSAYSGMALLMDHDRAILDRLLVTPASRGAVIGAYVAQSGLTVIVQASVILVVGLLLGAHIGGGVAGFLVVLVAGSLLGAGFGALSNALALHVMRHDAIIAIMNFIILPLTFLSSMMMAPSGMPDWIRLAAGFNPVNWAVELARAAFFGTAPGALLVPAAALALFTLVCVLIAVRSFQRFMAKA